MTFSTRLVFIAVALLTAPIASHGQGECDLPTQEDVENVGGSYLSSGLPEGSAPITMTTYIMNFTCLATVALDKYSYASVVVNATDSDNTPVTTVRQFQLQCSGSNVWEPHGSSQFDSNIPSDPFDLETEIRCSNCRGFPDGTPNYNAATNCLYCNTACGSQFCTGEGPNDCCQGFNGDTGDCVDNCATIDPNFGPNDNFVCAAPVTATPTPVFSIPTSVTTTPTSAATTPTPVTSTPATPVSTTPTDAVTPPATDDGCSTGCIIGIVAASIGSIMLIIAIALLIFFGILWLLKRRNKCTVTPEEHTETPQKRAETPQKRAETPQKHTETSQKKE